MYVICIDVQTIALISIKVISIIGWVSENALLIEKDFQTEIHQVPYFIIFHFFPYGDW